MCVSQQASDLQCLCLKISDDAAAAGAAAAATAAVL